MNSSIIQTETMKKFVISLIATFLLLVFSFPDSNIDAKAATSTKYATSNLNVRATASTKAKIVTTVKKNQAVTVSQTKNGWSKVTANKKTGWVSAKYLTAKKPVTSKTAKASVTKTMYATANLNVRASASTKAKVVTTIKKNQAVTVSQTKNSWAKVKVNGKTGWVSTKYLTAKKPETSKTMYAKAATPLKATASTKAKTLVNVKKNASVTVYSTASGNYYKAKVGNKTGWILKTQVSDTKVVKETVKEAIPFKTVKMYKQNLPKGKTQVVQKGKNGSRTKVVQKTYKNGKLTATKVLSTTVTAKAVEQIVEVGVNVGELHKSQGYLPRAIAILELQQSSLLTKNADQSLWTYSKNGKVYAQLTLGQERVTKFFFDYGAYAERNKLEAEAMKTYDWSKVSKNEAIRSDLGSAASSFVEALFGSETEEGQNLRLAIQEKFKKEHNTSNKKTTVKIGGKTIEITTNKNTMTVVPK